MKKLLLLFPLLLGCVDLNAENVAKRNLFIRNGIYDTLQVKILSPDANIIKAVYVAPNDSTCVQYPFTNVRVVLVASTRTGLQVFSKNIGGEGLDWLLIGANQDTPASNVCGNT